MSAPPDLFNGVVPAGERPEDLGTLHQERQAEIEREQRRQRWQNRLANAAQPTQPQLEDPATPGPDTGKPEQTMGPRDEGNLSAEEGGSVAKRSLPGQAVGGFFDAIKQNASAIKDLADLTNLPGVIYEPGKGVRIGSGEEMQSTPGALETAAGALPDVPESGTVAGGLVRGVTQFTTDFALLGKAKPFQALSKLGTAGRVAAPMLRGAVADFAAFDPGDERLSNLVQEFPALANPVSEYLAADPTDSAAEGRFKQAIEGLGVGAATDGFLKAIRATRGLRRFKAESGLEDAATRQLIETSEAQRGKLIELFGDPAGKPVELRPIEGAAEGEAGEVFVNWSRIGSPDDVKAMIQELANARAGSIDKARRGVRSWEATRISAEQRNAWELLAERKIGQPFNAEESVAVRELWVRSGARVKELAEMVRSEPGDFNRAAFRRQLAVHNAIQEQVIAARTETARALNAWRINVGDAVDFAGQVDQLRALAQSDRDVDDIAQGVLQLAQAGKVKELDAFVQGTGVAKGREMIRQAYYMALLSSPHTHMRNLIGNSATIPLQMTERKVAAWVGRVFGEQNVPDGEAAAQLFGALQGFQRAFRFGAQERQVFSAARASIKDDPAAAREMLAQSQLGTFWRSVLTGETGIGMGRPEAPRGGAFSAMVDPENPYARVAAWMDTATTAPMRALAGSDEIFKTITYDMELSAQAFRKASGELASGQLAREQFNDRVTDLMQNPDDYMRMAAAKFSETSTFSQQTGKFGRKAGELANATPWGIGRYVLPFRSTPFNIASFTFRRTPIAPFMKSWREEIQAGGARGDIAWSQFLVGNAILTTFADLAMQGAVTGVGPADPNERAALVRTGWQPNSVKIGDRYYSYLGLEPLGTSLGLASNTVDILRFQDWEEEDSDWSELLIASSMAIAAQATSQQYMSGVSGFFEVMSDPQRYGETYVQRLVQAPIPRAVALATKVIDPNMRMATDLGDAIVAATPGLSKNLPPARDVWGRPRTYSSDLGKPYDFISPIHSRSGKDAQPIDLELQAIEHYVGMPGKTISFEGESVPLKNRPDVYSRYVELAGNELKLPVLSREKLGLMDALNALVTGKLPASRMYEKLTPGPDGDRGKMIDDVVSAYRDAARAQLLEEFPDLRARVDRSVQERRQQRLTLQAR